MALYCSLVVRKNRRRYDDADSRTHFPSVFLCALSGSFFCLLSGLAVGPWRGADRRDAPRRLGLKIVAVLRCQVHFHRFMRHINVMHSSTFQNKES